MPTSRALDPAGDLDLGARGSLRRLREDPRARDGCLALEEGAAKAVEVPGARWQLVGPLQSNKARRALEVYEAVQSVESVGLAERLDRLAARAARMERDEHYWEAARAARRRGS